MTDHSSRSPAPGLVALVDGIGALADRLGWRSDAAWHTATRIAAARRKAGATDFGEPPVREPLSRLLASFREESRASQTGRLAMGAHLQDLLVARLQLERRWAAAGAAADAEPVRRPVFIFGLPRTGTTLLHNLIAQDPAVRVPWTWEVMLPVPRSGRRDDEAVRRRAAAARLRWVDRLAPAFRTVHAVDAGLPQECIAIMAYALQSIEFHTTHRLPAYQDWFEASDQRPAYAWLYRFLQHLQSGDRRHGRLRADQDPRRWVLKAPGHLFGLDALLDVFPDAVLIQTHRDPLKVVASIASHGVILREAFSGRVDRHEVATDWSARWARALERTLAMRRGDPQLDARVLDLRYEDVVADPLDAIARLYAHAGLVLSPAAREAMGAFLARNPQGRHGRHRYSLEQFGLDAEAERARFAAYRAYMNV